LRTQELGLKEGKRKEEGGRRKEEGGRRKEEGGNKVESTAWCHRQFDGVGLLMNRRFSEIRSC